LIPQEFEMILFGPRRGMFTIETPFKPYRNWFDGIRLESVGRFLPKQPDFDCYREDD